MNSLAEFQNSLLELQKELAEYCQNMEEIQRVSPSFQSQKDSPSKLLSTLRERVFELSARILCRKESVKPRNILGLFSGS